MSKLTYAQYHGDKKDCLIKLIKIMSKILQDSIKNMTCMYR